MAGLIEELALGQVVLAGYDIGAGRPGHRQGPARPGARRGHRAAGARGRATASSPRTPQREFWYQAFHDLALSDAADRRQPRRRSAPTSALLDALVRTRLRARPAAARPPRRRLRAGRARSSASINWYRAGSASVAGRWPSRPPTPADRITAADHRAVARARPAVPARLVGPGRRLLRRRADLASSTASATSPAGSARGFAAAVAAAARADPGGILGA